MRQIDDSLSIGSGERFPDDGGKFLFTATAQSVRQLQINRKPQLLARLNPALLKNDLCIKQKPVLIKNRPLILRHISLQ